MGCDGILREVSVWEWWPKLRKRAKWKSVVPSFGVYKGFVVIVRGECLPFEELRLRIFDWESGLRWYFVRIGRFEIFLKSLIKSLICNLKNK